MADAKARKAVIKKAASQVRTGGAFMRRASTGGATDRAEKSHQTGTTKPR